MLEAADLEHWSYVAPSKPTPGEDGDSEVLRESMTAAGVYDSASADETCDAGMNLEDELFVDGLDPVEIAENECRDAITEMLQNVEESPEAGPEPNLRGGTANSDLHGPNNIQVNFSV